MNIAHRLQVFITISETGSVLFITHGSPYTIWAATKKWPHSLVQTARGIKLRHHVFLTSAPDGRESSSSSNGPLNLGKRVPGNIAYKAGMAPHPVKIFRRREKFLAPAGSRNMFPIAQSQYRPSCRGHTNNKV
jgi:hypothetical protein